MGHPLEDVINQAEGIVVIGDSAKDRFPGFSYAAYMHAGKSFYCLDLGGLPESRGPYKGGKVYHTVEEIPEDHGDLAIIWVHPHDAKNAVDVANELGCKRVWFSFQTGHPDAVSHARDLGMEVVEIGRCPVYYMDNKPTSCAAHAALTKLSGTYKRPPQTDVNAKRRELW